MASDDGFLSRWSRRKVDARQGRPLDEPQVLVPKVVAAEPLPPPPAGPSSSVESQASPTLAQVAELTPESDFTAFVARGVTPEVKNAAMKKLFSDPHFNVMDGLDIYIDDYNRPDPLPLAMLRQMTSAQTMNLFEDKEQTSRPALDLTNEKTDVQSSSSEVELKNLSLKNKNIDE